MRSAIGSVAACALLAGVGCLVRPAAAQDAGAGPCDGAEYRILDFWIGEWEVFAGGERAGTDRIEKILGGCAISESWRSAAGGEGRSLFYYVPAAREWRQVWVTADPERPGGVKEKRLVERLAGGAVRFQGEISLAGGGTYLDRTTLTPLPGGEVEQRIEVSTDAGGSWHAVFDGRYERRGAEPAAPDGR